MDEAEWLANTNPTRLLDVLRRQATPRKYRLCAAAFCRSIIPLLDPPRIEVEQIVAVAERFADGLAPEAELREAHEDSIPWDHDTVAAIAACRSDARWAARNAVRHTTAFVVDHWARSHPQCRRRGKEHLPAKVAHNSMLCALIRDIFGPALFRPLGFDAHWLAWNNGIVKLLAEDAYERRIMPVGALDADRLAVLADAVEEAGCDNQNILNHLRGPGPHTRGCWVLDLLTGRE